MWVRKQEADAQWQEFSTPAAALRHIKAEGARSTLQQVQIKRAAKNSKPRNGFEFSYNPPPPPRRRATATPTVPSRLPSHYDAIHRRLCGSFGCVILQQLPWQAVWGD